MSKIHNQSNIEIELKNLLKLSKDTKKPKRMKDKNGNYTKKFITFNKKLIREGKTFNFVIPDIVYNTETKRFNKVKYDKRFKDKNILTKKFKDVSFLGNSVITKSIIYKKKKVSNEDRNKLNNKFVKFFKSKKDTVEINLSKYNLGEALKLADNRFNTTGKFNLIARVKNTPNWIAISGANVDRLEDFKELTGDNFQQRVGSDNEFIYNLNKSPIIEFKKIKSSSKKKKLQGAFFKYYHNLNFDLSRYDIYNEKPKNYNDNCLYIALKNSGLSNEKLNDFKSFVKSHSICLSDMPKICNKLNIHIKLSRCKLINGEQKNNTTHYGDKNLDSVNICLFNDHYFINEKTNLTAYSLKNYNDIKDLEKWNEIYKFQINSYKRDKTRFINSFELFKILNNDEYKLLRNIPTDDILGTQYWSNEIENNDLDFNNEKCCKINKPSETDNIEYYTVYFDFETITNSGNHKAYLMCYQTEDGKKGAFVGPTCGKQFINRLKTFNYDKILLVAHNLRYDYTFIMDYLQCPSPLFKGNSIMGGNAKIFRTKDKFIDIKFQDSYNLIPTKLSGFSSMFNLTSKKEIIPYSLYTQPNIERQLINLEECLEYVKNECCYNKDINDEEKIKEVCDLFKKNCEEWKCLYNNEVDIIEYSKQYCFIDVHLLRYGYETFRRNIDEISNEKIDIKNYCSLASVALDYMIINDVFKDCYKICGRPQNFIQKCVVGGRCMTADNKKHHIKGKIQDFDAVSLYPSAMYKMKGVLKGKPKVLQNNELNENFLMAQDGFFVKAMCLNNPVKNLHFPLLSKIDKNGIRNFTNETKNEIFHFDKTTYEEVRKYQNLEFKFICGYYYNDGHNTKIKDAILHLFKSRLQAKKEKNPIQAVYKLLMNSGYGKCMLKPIETEQKIISKKRFEDYLSRNYNFVREFTKLNDNYFMFKMTKSINEHYNNVYYAVEVLSNSKRIMNNVMCLAEENNFNMYYTDTDSIHIDEQAIKPLAEKYKEKHGLDLIGKNLGQFHSDFDSEIIKKNIVATESYFLGKKCYIDKLEGLDEKGKNAIDYHIRLKGIPNSSIKFYSDINDIGLMEQYGQLFEGQSIKYDLLAGGRNVSFEYKKDLNIISRTSFERKVAF